MAKNKNAASSVTQPVTTDLVVEYSTRSWITRERNSDDEWDRDDTESEHTLHGISIASKSSYNTVTYPGEIKPGDKIYLLYAVYSTGDSFGHDDCHCIEFISVHKDIDIARWNYNKLQVADKDDYSSQVLLSQDNGQTWKMTPPWCGYFESLDYVRVAGFTVLPEGTDSNFGSSEHWYDDIS